MPETSDGENNSLEKRKAHNNVEKKRKDKLKLAIDDFRNFLPAAIIKNKKLSHHEVLLKALEYMKELEKENKRLLLETSDTIKGEIIGSLKLKLEESFKEIGNLKEIIEKNCLLASNSVNVVQSWKSKGKANKACQVNRDVEINSKNNLNNIINKNKKQKKGFTIAQRLNCGSELSFKENEDGRITEVDQSSVCRTTSSTKSCVVFGDNQALPQTLNLVNLPSAEHLQMFHKLASKEQNPIFLCYNDKVGVQNITIGVNDSLNSQTTTIILGSNIPNSLEPSSNILSNNSMALLCPSGQFLPVSTTSLSLGMLPYNCIGLPYQISTSHSEPGKDVNSVDIFDNISFKCHKEVEKRSQANEKAKHSTRTRQKFKVLHCCNWYWKNIQKRKKKSFRSFLHLKSFIRSSASNSTIATDGSSNKENNLFSNTVSSENVTNTNDPIEDVMSTDCNANEKLSYVDDHHTKSSESFDMSTSIAPKTNKPIWVVAKNMESQEDDPDLRKGNDDGDNCSLQNSKGLPLQSKNHSDIMISQIIPNPKSDYHDITSLLLNPISTFSDLYDRNMQNKTLEQSFMEDSTLYGAGVSYLNENDLQFEIEDDMFSTIPEPRISQPSNSPFINHISFDKVKPRESRKDCQLNFSFNSEAYHTNNLNPTDAFSLPSTFAQVDRTLFSSATSVLYRPVSFQSPNIVSDSNISRRSSELVNVFSTATNNQIYASAGNRHAKHAIDKTNYPIAVTSICNYSAAGLDKTLQHCQTSERDDISKSGSVNAVRHLAHHVGGTTCRVDENVKNQFNADICMVSTNNSRQSSKELRAFDFSSFALKHVQESSLVDSQSVASNNAFLFNGNSDYMPTCDKMWLQNSSVSLFTPRSVVQNQHETGNASSKMIDSTPVSNVYYSLTATGKLTADKDKQAWQKPADNLFPVDNIIQFYLKSQESSFASVDSSNIKPQNSSLCKGATKRCSTQNFAGSKNEDSSSHSDSSTKVVFTVNQQISTATKLWNPDQHTLKCKPFKFFPLSYNASNSSETKSNYISFKGQKIDDSQIYSANTSRPDTFLNSSDLQDDVFKTSSHILSFIPSHPLKSSFPISKSYAYGEPDVCNSQFTTVSFTNNYYPSSLQANELHCKSNENSNEWIKTSLSKGNPTNFAPFFSLSTNCESLEATSQSFQMSPITQSKSNYFSSEAYYKSFDPHFETNGNKIATKRPSVSSNKSVKKLQKVTSPQELFSKNQKSNYYGGYSTQCSYYPSDLIVGPFDRPTYLTNDDQLMPSYNAGDQTSELNLNSIFVPLPSHQSNDIRLNLYQNQSHCSSVFPSHPPTNSSPLTLSSNRFSSALPSIHHFGIGNIFTDFSHPLTFGADVSNVSSMRVTQPETLIASPPHYRYNMNADAAASISNPSSLHETNYQHPHVPSLFNYHATKQTHTLNKNSMSINNLLGNQKPF